MKNNLIENALQVRDAVKTLHKEHKMSEEEAKFYVRTAANLMLTEVVPPIEEPVEVPQKEASNSAQ